MYVISYRNFSKSNFPTHGVVKEKVWHCFFDRFTVAAIPVLDGEIWHRIVTMFAERSANWDIVDCPLFAALEGALREDNSSRFNLGQLTKRIHGKKRRMASIHHYFARKQVGDTQKRGKPEMCSSCRKLLDLHWSASARPGRGSASVPHLRHLSVSRHWIDTIWRGRDTTSPAQRSTTAGAIF